MDFILVLIFITGLLTWIYVASVLLSSMVWFFARTGWQDGKKGSPDGE